MCCRSYQRQENGPDEVFSTKVCESLEMTEKLCVCECVCMCVHA